MVSHLISSPFDKIYTRSSFHKTLEISKSEMVPNIYAQNYF